MKLANALENIDDDLLVEAMDTTSQGKSRKILRWGILAACLILLISTVTVAATTDLGEWIVNGFTWEPLSQSPDKDPYGYRVHLPIDLVPLSQLTGEIQEVPAIVLEKIANQQIYDSVAPTYFVKYFDTPEDALEYIGLDGLQTPHWNLEPKLISFHSNSLNTTGEIQTLTLMIGYNEKDISITTIATVYTELWPREAVIGFGLPEHNDQTFTESTYTTANGLECNIITGSNSDNDRLQVNAFVVYKGILYTLSTAYDIADTARAEEILHLWADQFGN